MKGLLLDYGPALLAWVAVVYKLPSFYRAPRHGGRRSLWLTLLFLALAITALVPPIYAGVDHLLGRPNLARLLSNSLTLVACWTVLGFLAHLSGASMRGREIRWTALLLGASLAAMAALFLTAPVYPEALDYPERYAAAPHVLEYRLIYLVYCGVTDATIVRLCWRYAKVALHASLRIGLRIVTAGGIAGVLYALNDFTYLTSQRFGVAYPVPDPITLHKVLVALSVILSVVGAVVPALGPPIRRYVALRRLYPLWVDLCRSCPEIALAPPPTPIADALNVRDLDFRLSRRVVEVRDGILTLRRFVEPEVMGVVARLSRKAGHGTTEAAATLDAATIVAGQLAKANGEEIRDVPIDQEAAGPVDLEGEVAELEQVARYYARSPVIRALRTWLATGADRSRKDAWISGSGHRDRVTRPIP